MAEPITAEAVFDKHVAAHDLPARSTDESFSDYVTRVSNGKKEATRRLQLAVEAARVADHADCALWCSQARQEIPADN